MILSVVSDLHPQTSYGLHTIQLARRLPKFGVDVVLRPARKCEGLLDDITALINPAVKPDVEMILKTPTLIPDHRIPTIYFAAHESTRLRPESVQMLNKADAVCVPSDWCATVFSANGVNKPIITVPLGASEAFSYRPMTTGGPFTFACAGNLQHGRSRKGLERVSELFRKAFPDGEAVRLLIKTGHEKQLWSPFDDRIFGFSTFLSEDQLADWLAQCHCFVNLATGGFELFPLEAAFVGRPTITIGYGGVTQYLHEGNALIASHKMVPAKDAWTSLGDWAEADEESVIAAMRYAANPDNVEAVSWMGHKAFWSTRHLTWDNHAKKIAEIAKAMLPKIPEIVSEPPKVKRVRSVNPMDDVTVCITAFNRPQYLERAVDSAKAAGFKVVIAEMTPEDDMGCNELWLRAAYAAKTERVIILHDDDVLLPELGDIYRKTISPAMDDGYAVTWRAAHLWDDGQVTPTEYYSGPSSAGPVSDLQHLILRSQLSLSPIITVFDRETLIHALKEAHEVITHYLHPGMPLGTEVLAHLRHSQGKKGWLYIDQVLSHYGVHDGSGTVKAERANNLAPLIRGYDAVRVYWKATPVPPKPEPRILFVYSDYNWRNTEEGLRFAQARETWDFHFNQGQVMEFAVRNSMLPRSSMEVGCGAAVPYVKDLLNYAVQFAMPEDIIVLCNRDVCLTSTFPERIITGIGKSKGIVACPRRDMQPIPTGKIFRSVKNFKPDGGYDVFAVTPAWWQKNRDQMPDMFLGREAWDTVLRVIAEEEAGDAAYVDDVCYHHAHLSQWQKERATSPSQLHNRRLGLEFFRDRTDERSGWIKKQLSE